MANTYTHRVVSLKKSNGAFLNLVNSFVLEITASDGTNQMSKEYTIRLNTPDPSDTFVEYTELTEADLISWYQGDIIQSERCKDDIDNALLVSTQDDVQSNFPWS